MARDNQEDKKEKINVKIFVISTLCQKRKVGEFFVNF